MCVQQNSAAKPLSKHTAERAARTSVCVHTQRVVYTYIPYTHSSEYSLLCVFQQLPLYDDILSRERREWLLTTTAAAVSRERLWLTTTAERVRCWGQKESCILLRPGGCRPVGLFQQALPFFQKSVSIFFFPEFKFSSPSPAYPYQGILFQKSNHTTATRSFFGAVKVFLEMSEGKQNRSNYRITQVIPIGYVPTA